jgi:hypothetical protein
MINATKDNRPMSLDEGPQRASKLTSGQLSNEVYGEPANISVQARLGPAENEPGLRGRSAFPDRGPARDTPEVTLSRRHVSAS